MKRVIFMAGKYMKNDTCIEITTNDLPKILECIKANPKVSNAYIEGNNIIGDVSLTDTELLHLEGEIKKA